MIDFSVIHGVFVWIGGGVGAAASAGGSQTGSNARSASGTGLNRSAGVTGRSASNAWWGRSALYWATQASTAACASSTEVNGPRWSNSSRRKVRWNRSTFPVVVGDAGSVSRWAMPLWRQILSNNTSPPRPNRPVNCLALSVNASSGIPYF